MINGSINALNTYMKGLRKLKMRMIFFPTSLLLLTYNLGFIKKDKNLFLLFYIFYHIYILIKFHILLLKSKYKTDLYQYKPKL